MDRLRVLVNGKVTDQIHVQDRGLQYGHGVFETIAWRENVLELWPAHMRRLNKGCTQLFIPLPDSEQLKSEALSLCSELDHAIIKIMITCGQSQRGYLIPDVQANRIVSCDVANKEQYDQLKSIAVTICNTRLAPQMKLAGLKHMNRLEQILARQEWRAQSTKELLQEEPHYQEGLMLDYEGHVISGTMSNLFFVKDAQLFTSTLALCGVQGVMRNFIIAIAQGMGLKVHSSLYNLQEVLEAEEVFMTNSLIKISAVNAIQATQQAVTNFNAPGPVTVKLWNQLQQNIKETLIQS